MNIRLLALALMACSSDPLQGQDTEVDGIVFKGPLVTGSSVVLDPLAADFSSLGLAVTAQIDADSGRYTASIPLHDGLVRVTAEGSLYDEAAADRVEETVTLSAYARSSGSVHVNLLGDLSRDRVRTLVTEGVEPSIALQTAQDELVAGLSLGGTPPTTLSSVLDIYNDASDAGWLLGASAVLSELAALRGDRAALFDEIRDDLAPDGLLGESLTSEVKDAEVLVDPAHVVDRLQAYFAELGIEETLPDAAVALDSDRDGVPNTRDVCPYVADPDQATTAGGWGQACDTRVTDMEASDGFACGLLVDGGELVCWHLDGDSPGGQPPSPDTFPTAQYGPWFDSPGLTGRFDSLSVGPGVVCAASPTESRCWTSTAGLFSLPGDLLLMDTSEQLICTLDADLDARCYNHAGAESFILPGPWLDAATVGADHVCLLTADLGEVQCFDATGASATFDNMPPPGQNTIEGTDTGSGFGATIDASGDVLVFGDSPFISGLIQGSSITVGEGSVCVEAFNGICMWDSDLCDIPDNGDMRPVAATGCVSCGIDSDGFGRCRPNLDDR